jgi:hypothetical protein
VSAIGSIPVGESIALFGKIGFYSGEQKVTAFGITLDEDDDGGTAGVGIRFNFDDSWKSRLEVDWFDTDWDSIWSISASVQYQFGN